MGLMKEIFIAEQERHEHEHETLQKYYGHLLMISDQEEGTKEIINTVKQK